MVSAQFEVESGSPSRPASPSPYRLIAGATLCSVLGCLLGYVMHPCTTTGYTPPLFSEANLYRALTGKQGHVLPEMYGKVGEKTIWAYWHHWQNCPNSNSCEMPPAVNLCIESIKANKGSFDFKLIHRDQVDKYVSRTELPFNWHSKKFAPAQQKDALMNALLARYGGVAMDLTIILLKDVLDEWWDEMLKSGAAFRGFWYEFQETPVWFLMARRETVFRPVVAAQVIEMGDSIWPDDCAEDHHHQYICLGDGMITAALCLYDQSYCRCSKDREGKCYPPERSEQFSNLPLKITTKNPRESVELFPYCFEDDYNMATWNLDYKAKDGKIVWQHVMELYKKGSLPFVKLFQSGGKKLKSLSREEILNLPHSFICNWLCLAGTNQCNIKCPVDGYQTNADS